MKKIVCLVMSLSFVLSAFARSSDGDAPKKGDWMVSFNFGVGSYIGISAPRPNLPDYALSAPMKAWFDKQPILDVEGRYFISDKWALKLTGGFHYGYNPGYSEVPGTGSEPGDIPAYNAVPNSSNIQYFIGVGGDRYFKTGWNGLFLKMGGEFGSAYGRVEAKADSEEYMGVSIGEAYTFKLAPVCGADYFFNSALFVGFDIRPIAYQYSVFNLRPQEGLGLLSSDNHSFSVLAQPMIKLGIRF